VKRVETPRGLEAVPGAPQLAPREMNGTAIALHNLSTGEDDPRTHGANDEGARREWRGGGAMTDDRAVLSWRCKRRPGFTLVELSGPLNENTDLRPLVEQLSGTVVLNLAEIRRINSNGVREWVNFVREVARSTDLTLTHCSVAIVLQLNTIYNFRGEARVRSFFAPYRCESCDHEEDRLLQVASLLEQPRHDPPRAPCGRCGGALELDEVAERYLAFLRDPDLGQG
jgi:ABC-type transporter Mla MlaB component